MSNLLSIKLTDSTTVNCTVQSTSLNEAKNYAQQLTKSGGFYDDAGVFHPSSAVLSVTIS